jgi:hypothetical protein
MTTVNSVGVSLSGQSGTGNFAGTTSPTFVTPALGTPSSGNLSNCTGLPGEFVWAANATTTITAAVGNGYITTAAGAVTVNLPTTFAVGTQIGIIGQGAGGWTAVLGASTNIKFCGNTYTTSAASTNISDGIILTASVANTTWAMNILSSTGLTAS